MDEPEILKCPAVRADVPDAAVLGIVVDGSVHYLDRLEPVGKEHHEAAAPATVDEVFRLAGTCYRCPTHWTGTGCGLVARIPKLIVDPPDPPGRPLPPCAIRFKGAGGCRHFAQAGASICRYCRHYAYATVVMPAGMGRTAKINDRDKDWL